MELVLNGTDLPGRTFRDPDGTPLDNGHVGLQIGTEPEHLVRGDATDARWELDIDTTIDNDGPLDFALYYRRQKMLTTGKVLQ